MLRFCSYFRLTAYANFYDIPIFQDVPKGNERSNGAESEPEIRESAIGYEF